MSTSKWDIIILILSCAHIQLLCNFNMNRCGDTMHIVMIPLKANV